MHATSTFGFQVESTLGVPYGAKYPPRSRSTAHTPTTSFPALLLKLRLFRRRLTISSPRMSVRSAMPWPVRWIVFALMLGFSAAIALWAFEVGKDIAGLDKTSREELSQLRKEAASLRQERDKAQSISNTSGGILIAEKAMQDKLASQIKQLQSDNRSLRDDLGFFEKLLPASTHETASIRGLQAEVVSETQLRWHVLVIQPVRDAPTFNGKLELTITGTQAGKAWTMNLPGGAQALQFKQSRRVEGMLDLPPSTMVKAVTAKIFEGNSVRAVQTFKL